MLKLTLTTDDETYLHLDPSNMAEKQFYHAKYPNAVNYKEKFIPKTKFTKIFMVWQSMDENGNI